MTIQASQLAPIIWIGTAVLVIVIIYGVIRFFWQHVIKLVLRIGAALLVVVGLLALLRYLGIL